VVKDALLSRAGSVCRVCHDHAVCHRLAKSACFIRRDVGHHVAREHEPSFEQLQVGAIADARGFHERFRKFRSFDNVHAVMSTSDRQYAGSQDVSQIMDDAALVAGVGNTAGQASGNAHRAFRLGQQQHAAITFLRQISGNLKPETLSSTMAGVALSVRGQSVV
jgi:hypothetical protein